MPPENNGSPKSDSRDATFRSIEAHLDDIAGQVSQLRDDLTRSCRDTDDILRLWADRLARLEVKVEGLLADPLDQLPERKPPPTLREWVLAVAAVLASIALLVAALQGALDLPACIAAVLKALK